MTLRALAQGVVETLDVLVGPRPLHVIGNSLGGAVALQLLEMQPHRVASLVLVNSAGFGREATLLLRMLTLPVIGRMATRRTTRAGARMLERAIFADRSLASRQRIEHAIAIGRQPDRGVVMHEIARELASGRGVKPGWRNELSRTATRQSRPTLIIWGGPRSRTACTSVGRCPAHHAARQDASVHRRRPHAANRTSGRIRGRGAWLPRPLAGVTRRSTAQTRMGSPAG